MSQQPERLRRSQLYGMLVPSMRHTVVAMRSLWGALYYLEDCTPRFVPQLLVHAFFLLPSTLLMVFFSGVRERRLAQADADPDERDVRKMFNVVENSALLTAIARILSPSMDTETYITIAGVPCLVFYRKGATSPPLRDILVEVHGGGAVACTPKGHAAYLRQWAVQLHRPIVAIDYSLSPEAVYPTALNQVVGVIEALSQDASPVARACGLTVANDQPVRLVCTGDSAGGQLCAAALARLNSHPARSSVVGVALVYPALSYDDDPPFESRVLYHNDLILGDGLRRFCRRAYSGQGDRKNDVGLSPIVASDSILASFPPTAIFVAQVDPLYSEGIALYDRLRSLPSTASTCSLRIFNGLPHGFLNFSSASPEGKKAVSEIATGIAKLFDC